MKISFKKIKRKYFKINLFLKVLLITLIPLSTFLLGILYEKIASNKFVEEEFTVAQDANNGNLVSLQNKVIKKNYVFKIRLGDLGKRMVEDGVIDKSKFAQALTGANEFPKDLDKYFKKEQNKIEVNEENAQFWVDFLWGLGLANKNRILEEGDMMQDGDASNFASTGGWTIGVGDPMNHYSGHSYISLSDKQQKMVEEIAGNIYRPCCGNSTAFPDCNHGMAMLGLIQLMVLQGFSEKEIYKTALAFNTYWFPQTYLDVAYHFEKNGRDYSKVPPKELLSKTFSSAAGYEVIRENVGQLPWPILESGGGSCSA